MKHPGPRLAQVNDPVLLEDSRPTSANILCQCGLHPLQIVEGVTVLVNSDAEFDLAAYTTLQDGSHGPLSQPGGKLVGESNHANAGTIDPATVDCSSLP